MKLILTIPTLISLTSHLICGQSHVSTGTNYIERGLIFLASAVRVDPTGYSKIFTKIANGTCVSGSTPVQPLYWNKPLTDAAKFHATAMASSNNKCFQHDTCPGYCDRFGNSCSWADRIWKYYGLAGIGEDIAKGFSSAYAAIDGFIKSRGHCNILMSNGYQEIGASYVNFHTVLDFGSKVPTNRSSQPIVVATHLTPLSNTPVDSNLLFCAVTEATKPPQGLTVQIGQSVRKLSLFSGKPERGVHCYRLENKDMLGSFSCQSYFFYLKDSLGKMTRFPPVGRLMTSGVNKCNINYSA